MKARLCKAFPSGPAIEAEFGRMARVEDMSITVYVLRVSIIETHVVDPPETAAAKLPDGMQEWDE